jgi:hypothetical protein
MPREGGASSTPRLLGSITAASGILDRPPSRTMTIECAFAFSRRVSPEVCHRPYPRRESRAQGMPGARCTRGLVCQKTAHLAHTSIQVSGNTPTSPAQWFYGLLRALPGERAFLPPSPLRSLLLKSLTPASRRQDHTTSPYASVQSSTEQKRPPHPIPTFSDDGRRPSSGMRRRRS